VAVALEALSVLVIAIGGGQAAYVSLWPLLTGRATHGGRRLARVGLARRVIPGLGVLLAAGLGGPGVAPTRPDRGQLAAIAVIRTFLNFFLERDLEAAAKAGWEGAELATAKESA